MRSPRQRRLAAGFAAVALVAAAVAVTLTLGPWALLLALLAVLVVDAGALLLLWTRGAVRTRRAPRPTVAGTTEALLEEFCGQLPTALVIDAVSASHRDVRDLRLLSPHATDDDPTVETLSRERLLVAAVGPSHPGTHHA